jgi:hypothetical protein
MTARRWVRPGLLAATAAVLAIAACTLNPQPLPPAAAETAGGPADGGGSSFGQEDAGIADEKPIPCYCGPVTAEAGTDDAGDAGDASREDAGDADAGH